MVPEQNLDQYFTTLVLFLLTCLLNWARSVPSICQRRIQFFMSVKFCHLIELFFTRNEHCEGKFLTNQLHRDD